MIVTETDEILVETTPESRQVPLSDITEQAKDAFASNTHLTFGPHTAASTQTENIESANISNEHDGHEEPLQEALHLSSVAANEANSRKQSSTPFKGDFMATDSQTSSLTQVTAGHHSAAVEDNSPAFDRTSRGAITSSRKTSAAEKPQSASARSPSARKKLVYERLSQGLPSTPLRREPSTQQLVKSVYPGPSSSQNLASDSTTGGARRKTGRKKIPKPWLKNAANRAAQKEVSEEDQADQHDSVIRSEIGNHESNDSLVTFDAGRVEQKGSVRKLSASPRRKSVLFARSIELEAGPHYSPVPKGFGLASPSTRPASIIRNFEPHPQPSPAADADKDSRLADRVAGPPPSASLGILGTFSYPPESLQGKSSSESSGEEDRSASYTDENGTNDSSSTAASDGSTAKRSSGSFGDFGLSNFWKRVNAAQAESDGTEESKTSTDGGTPENREEVEVSMSSGSASFSDGESSERAESGENLTTIALHGEESASEWTDSPRRTSFEEDMLAIDEHASSTGNSRRDSESSGYVSPRLSDADTVSDDEAAGETDDQDCEEQVTPEFSSDDDSEAIGSPSALHLDVLESHAQDDTINTPVAVFYSSSDDEDFKPSSENASVDSASSDSSAAETGSNPTLSDDHSGYFSNGNPSDLVSRDNSEDDTGSNQTLSDENPSHFSNDTAARSASVSSVPSSGEFVEDPSETSSESTACAGEATSLKASDDADALDVQSKNLGGRRTSLFDTIYNAAKSVTRRFSAGHDTVSDQEAGSESQIDPEDLDTASEHSEDILYVEEPASRPSRSPVRTEAGTTMHTKDIENAASLLHLGADRHCDVSEDTSDDDSRPPMEETSEEITASSREESDDETTESGGDEQEQSSISSEEEALGGNAEMDITHAEYTIARSDPNSIDSAAALIGSVSIQETTAMAGNTPQIGSLETDAPQPQVQAFHIDDIPVDDLGNSKVVTLRKMLQKRGLPTCGNKAELVNRLAHHAKNFAEPSNELRETDADSDGTDGGETTPVSEEGGSSRGEEQSSKSVDMNLPSQTEPTLGDESETAKGKASPAPVKEDRSMDDDIESRPADSDSEQGIDNDITVDRSQYRKRTVKELQYMLRRVLIKTPGKLRKEQLIDALIANNVGPDGNALDASLDESSKVVEEPPTPVMETPRTRSRARMMRTPVAKTPTERIRKSSLRLVEELTNVGTKGEEESVKEEPESEAPAPRSAMSTRSTRSRAKEVKDEILEQVSKAKEVNDEISEQVSKSEKKPGRKAKRNERGRKSERIAAKVEIAETTGGEKITGEDSSTSVLEGENESGKPGRRSTRKSVRSAKSRAVKEEGGKVRVESSEHVVEEAGRVATRSSSRAGRSRKAGEVSKSSSSASVRMPVRKSSQETDSDSGQRVGVKLERMTVAALRNILRDIGEPQTGTKTVLIERLRKYDEGNDNGRE